MTTTTYRAEVDHVEDDTPCYCGDCDWHGVAQATKDVEDCTLTPGDASPVGRCPECDSLAYLYDKASRVLVAAVTEANKPEHDGNPYLLVLHMKSGHVLRGAVMSDARYIEEAGYMRLEVWEPQGGSTGRHIFISAGHVETAEIEW